MKFTVTFSTINDAFEGVELDPEIIRILNFVEAGIRREGSDNILPLLIYDTNGNRIGLAEHVED